MELMSGNAAIARGAYEAGVLFAAGYPGTPSTEILENLARYAPEVYCEWAPNEKVALEAAAGAALSSARALVTMKHVGLNVAADPLMTLAYTGVVGGLVVCVADDPGMHSSQNEQDSRNYAKFAKLPLLEPSDSQEAKDFVRYALEISEQFATPVILRTTTRVSHSRGLVETENRRPLQRKLDFEPDPARFVTIPLYARPMRVKLEERLDALQQAAEASPLNRIELRDRKLGIIACGLMYQYVREVFPEASVLKLGWAYPWPDSLFRRFAAEVEEVLVLEELDPLVEEHVRSLGIAVRGRDVVPGIGELTPERLMEVKERLAGRVVVPPEHKPSDLPARPPVLCPGCPHRGIFHTLNKFDAVVTGDIGCYSLGVLPPLGKLNTILCMGAGLSMAHGLAKVGNARPVVGMVGDSTFFHSGITGLLDVGYNQSSATLVVLDNRTTAMTGHQDHPGTGRTLMGTPTREAKIEDFAHACGLQHVRTVNPYDLDELHAVFSEALASPEPYLIVSKAPCPLKERKPLGPLYEIDPEACKNCRVCLKLGCPAIEATTGEKPVINAFLCNGCGLCPQVCKFDAIHPVEQAEGEE